MVVGRYVRKDREETERRIKEAVACVCFISVEQSPSLDH
jgi:hypothetical protein